MDLPPVCEVVSSFVVSIVPINGFQSVRPLAKKLVVDHVDYAGEMLHFDFSSVPKEEDGTAWGKGTSVTDCKLNIYKASKTFKKAGYPGLEFVFSYTEDTGSSTQDDFFGTTYYSDKTCLIMLQGNKGETTQTLGLPVREGYKLVRVEGRCDQSGQAYAGTYVAITSNKEGITVTKNSMNTSGTHQYANVIVDDSTIISEFEGMTAEKKVIQIEKKQATPWIFTIPNAQKDTRYYLSASGPYLCIEHLYLTYEKVE